MGKVFKRVPSPSMAVAFIALLVALGGTAVALPGKSGVKKDDIAKGAVNTTDIANNTIRTQDIRTSNVRGSDIAANTVTGSDVSESSLGKVPSAANSDSAANAAALGGVPAAAHLRNQELVTFPGGIILLLSSPSEFVRDTSCSNGKRVLGGGADAIHANDATAADESNVVTKESFPLDADTWRTVLVETDPVGTNWGARGWAICG